MTIRKWIVAAVFGWSILAGWAVGATAVECLYPSVADAAEVTLLEVTRDGEVVEDLGEWKTAAGRYGLRGYYFGVEMSFEGDDGTTYNKAFERVMEGPR